MEDAPNTLPLWICNIEDVSPFETHHFHQTVSENEFKRAHRMHTPELQKRVMLTRFLIRKALSAYRPDVLPQSWQFEAHAHGKPYTSNPLSTPLFFNISHSTSVITLAFAPFPLIGLDVEHVHMERNHRLMDIAEHSFSEVEVDELKALPMEEQRNHFYRLWTLKEAFIKASGAGLSMGLKSFGFTDIKLKDGSVTNLQLAGKAKNNHGGFSQTQWQTHMLALCIQPTLKNDLSLPSIAPLQITLKPKEHNIVLESTPIEAPGKFEWASTSSK